MIQEITKTIQGVGRNTIPSMVTMFIFSTMPGTEEATVDRLGMNHPSLRRDSLMQ